MGRGRAVMVIASLFVMSVLSGCSFLRDASYVGPNPGAYVVDSRLTSALETEVGKWLVSQGYYPIMHASRFDISPDRGNDPVPGDDAMFWAPCATPENVQLCGIRERLEPVLLVGGDIDKETLVYSTLVIGRIAQATHDRVLVCNVPQALDPKLVFDRFEQVLGIITPEQIRDGYKHLLHPVGPEEQWKCTGLTPVS